MSNDRITKSLLAVIAGLLAVVALRGGGGPQLATVAAAQPDAGAKLHLQISGTPTSFMVFDEDTGQVLRGTTDAAAGIGISQVGTIRRNPQGNLELAPDAGGAAAPRADATKITKAQADLASILGALNAFKLDTGRYPSTEEGLYSLVVQPTSGADNWKGPYLKPTVPMDPWGNPYVYHFPGRADAKRAELMSFGPDRKEGGGDDLNAAGN